MARETVLVADPDPRGLQMIELALRRAGFTVAAAANGGDATRKLADGAVLAAVLDAALSEPDAIALCRSVRANAGGAGMPLIVVGADNTPAARARALEAGADDYLAKPVLLKELVQRVQHLLDRRRLSDPGAPALTGAVRDLGLVDALQTLESSRKSAIVRCERSGELARVWVRDGEVIDAELGPLSGEPAFWRLMTWESGDFRIDFADVGKREPRIRGGTQVALVEALRRVEEIGRIAQTLPIDTRLTVDVARLAERLSTLPDDVNAVLRQFDGVRTLRAALDLSPTDDLAALAIVQRLIEDRILRPISRPASLQPWVSAPPRARVRAEPVAPRIVQFPPIRGARRERLQREEEQARAKIAAGEAVRLHHVVELPERSPEESLGPLRSISPAVGAAAKRFTPDARLARLSWPEREAEPPIAPV